LPIAVIAHPFGLRQRDEVREMAKQCVADIVKLVAAGGGNGD
jgi:diacylglycerol kinase family enzyme